MMCIGVHAVQVKWNGWKDYLPSGTCMRRDEFLRA